MKFIEKNNEKKIKRPIIFLSFCLSVFLFSAYPVFAYPKNSVPDSESYQRVSLSLKPLDAFFAYQDSYYSQITIDRAWNIVRESPEVVVAVIDTGVDIDHFDLKTNIWRNTDEIADNGIDDDGNGFVDDVYGWDFLDNSPDPRPKFDEGYTQLALNHGTVVAGVIAAQGANDVGVAGITWRVHLMPLRVLDGSGSGNTIDVAKAVNYARENGADIINLSFIGEDRSQILELAIERAYRAGIFIVAAAGNEVVEGIDMDVSPRYPVCQDGPENENWIIGVTTVDSFDRKASFSNFGKNCIDITAPGVRIFSTQFTADHPDFKEAYGGGWTGTSVSAPQVSGVAALVKQLDPDISILEWQRLVLEHTDNINPLNPQWQGKLGSGRLNGGTTVIAAASRRVVANGTPLPRLVTGAGPGGGPHVRMFSLNANISVQFFAFENDFTGGVNVVAGNVDGDTDLEFVAVPTEQRVPEVRVFNHLGVLTNSFLAYEPEFRFGMNLAVADFDGNGIDEIVTVPREGGGPHVRIFSSSGALKQEFFAFNHRYRGGVSITVADVDFDGEQEIIAATGSGSSPLVRIFNFKGEREGQFFGSDPDNTKGLNLAAANGIIVVGSGEGSEPVVRVFDYLGNKQAQWLAYAQGFRGGVHVAVSDINRDSLVEIITGPGKSGGPHLRVFDKFGTLITQWMAYNPGFRGGISVNTSQ